MEEWWASEVHSYYHFLVLVINLIYFLIILYQVSLLLKNNVFLFHFARKCGALMGAFNSTLPASFSRDMLICNRIEAMTLPKYVQNMKDTGERRRRREKERERKAIRAKQLFLMLYSTSCTSPQRDTEGHGERCLGKHYFQSVLKNGCALCLCCHERTGREEEGTTRLGGEQNGN